MPATKVATCCYCGTRAALVLRGKDRHELSCRGCGAPLHDLKMIPRSDQGEQREVVKPSRIRNRPDDPIKGYKWDERKRKKRKKRKSLGRKVLEEAWDVLEDIFD
ncbi:MAG: hypothetical protein AAFQ47_08990 [Pseudomonadota bacterium]